MQCPYCQAPLEKTSEKCPSCQLSLQSAQALLGPMPRLGKGLVDTLGVLKKGSGKKIGNMLNKLNRRFPQVEMHVLIKEFDIQHPLSTHLFWFFNQGEFCASHRKGGKNHTLLLGVDPLQGQIGLSVGYGLETYLPQKDLDHTLEKAQPFLVSGDLTQAILTVIHSIDQLMENICEDLPETAREDQGQIFNPIEY